MSTFKIRIWRSGGDPVLRWAAEVIEHVEQDPDIPFPQGPYEVAHEFAFTRKGVERKARRAIRRVQKRRDRAAAAETIDG